ncbi:sulfonate ABC transporter substrate-binding protein [Arthrobacter sp. MYb211]|uniref:ABC transporter substrate-binding protein n=1 Tax=unclassified Arthrobacter TaxID=235627 RepID=UPI000CFA88D2|nr:MULTISPECIES: ABC transporter substrate-binding protein [unclassified Arthrobacter]PRA12543.1 sulfonate ABC transporter substrate-binding protein [Arthrobacter sp. MYb221]PRC09936.1 sulfonate ABC transporter substrate-binding protein [Arthrobacter sp. MYb211]
MQPPEHQSSERQRFTSLVEQPNHRARFAGVVLVGVLAALALTTTVVPPPSTERSAAAGPSPAAELRLGYFANVTHAPALIADQRGILESALETDSTALETQIFNAGPAAIEALNSGALDAAYLGPAPALNSYLSSGGSSLQVVAGATNGGASLVVSEDIASVEQLAGTELATPQFGGTQDVALRNYLQERGIQDSVTVTPSSNGTVPQLFAREAIDGAWLPEPHASLLVEQYGAHRLVDEATLWPDGKFPTTVLVVNQDFLEEHPQTVKELVAANAEAISWLNTAETAERLAAVQEALTGINGSSLPDTVIGAALGEVGFDENPLESTFPTLMEHLESVGLGDSGDLSKIVNDQWIGTD